MRGHWTKRRAHQRRSKSGSSTFVRATWELRPNRNRQRAQVYRHACPHCGAGVLSVHMKKGGWAHFEGAKGLGSVKHACFHRGEGLGRRRDDATPDLFDKPTPRMARPRQPLQNTAARSWCAEVRRFLRLINTDKVFGTHSHSGSTSSANKI